METSNPCLIEQQLANLKASSRSSSDLDLFFRLLKDILSNLINNPFEDKYRTIPHNSPIFMNGLLKTTEVIATLKVLGFHEENAQYIHHISDENLMKVESCLNLLDIFRSCPEVTSPLSELSDEEVQEELDNQISSKKAKSLPDLWTAKAEKTAKRATNSNTNEKGNRVKSMILTRQLQKEENKERARALKSPAAVSSGSLKENASVTFNANGYFHQCCNSRNQRKDRSAITDFFHKQDFRHAGRSLTAFNKVI